MKGMYLRWCGVVVCILLLGVTTRVWAEDGDSQDYEPAPTYQNAAQASHDANVAEAYFERTDDEMAALQEEQEELSAVQDPDANITARIAEIDELLDKLYTDRADVEDGKIAEMRADGMGWGEIAHQLGVHPGVLGLGHTKKSTFGTELAMATATDLKTGNSAGHGQAYGGGSGAKNGINGNANGKENNGNKDGGHGNGNNNGNGNDNKK